MTAVSSMWCLNLSVVSCRWRDVRFSGPRWLLHCVWLCNLAVAVQTRLWNVIGASRPGERGFGTTSGLKGETWSNPHPHTEEMCHIAHTFGGQWVSVLRFIACECLWYATCSKPDQAFSQIRFHYCTFKTSVCKWPLCNDFLTSVYQCTWHCRSSGLAKLLNTEYTLICKQGHVLIMSWLWPQTRAG